MSILKIKDAQGNWKEIPAISGSGGGDTTELQKEISDVKKDLRGKVGFTDYATNTNGGTIFGAPSRGFSIDSGQPYARQLTNEQYETADNYTFVGKGSLENVLNERLKEPQSELITTVTLSETSGLIEISADDAGNPLQLVNAYLVIEYKGSTNSLGTLFMCNNANLLYLFRPFNDNSYAYARAYHDSGLWIGEFSQPATLYGMPLIYGSSPEISRYPRLKAQYPYITKVRVYKNNSGGVDMGAGTTIKLYGVKA